MATRKRRTQGHIEERSNGSFRVIVCAGRDPLTGKDRRLRKTCPSRRMSAVSMLGARAGLTAPILSWLDGAGADLSAAVNHDTELAVPDRAHLEAIARRAAGVRVHLHLDIGFARDGAAPPGAGAPGLRRHRGRLRPHVVSAVEGREIDIAVLGPPDGTGTSPRP